MTAQYNDLCFHRGTEFSVAGISGSGLFDPGSVGVKPVGFSSACWRGYIAHYTVNDAKLFLTSLHIGLPQGQPPRLFGVSPASTKWLGWLYDGFQLPIAFTGGLLLASGFLKELYVHMGFHPPWKYERVSEVLFDAGRMVEEHDRSIQMAAVRTKLSREEKQLHDQSIPRWIEKCFSRDY